MNFENLEFPDVNFEIPKTTTEGTPVENNTKSEPSIDVLREKRLSLAEKGKINYTPKYIQKANRDVLEKIKIKYDRKSTEKSSKIISNLLVSKLSDILEKTDLIDSSSELKQELEENELFKEELSEVVNDEIIPLIPKIGLVRGGVTVAKHIIRIRVGKRSKETEKPSDDEMKSPPDVDLNL